MRIKIILLSVFALLSFSLGAQNVVIIEKSSVPYSGPVEKSVFNTKKGAIEITNKLDFIEVRKGKKVYQINPISLKPNMMYIRVSLSPNGKMILFRAPKSGTFVCNLKGDILYELKDIESVSWFDNKHVIGVSSMDDGHKITKSVIEMVNVRNGRSMIVKTEEKVAAFPFASKPYITYYSDKSKHTIKVKIKK